MEKYLIKWKGRQSGPFTVPELRRMLESREIKPLHEIQVGGEWKTLRAFLKEFDGAPALPVDTSSRPTQAMPKSRPPERAAPPIPEQPAAGDYLASHAPSEPVSHEAVTRVLAGERDHALTTSMIEPDDDFARSSGAGPCVERELLIYAGFWNRALAGAFDHALVTLLPLWILGRIFQSDTSFWAPVAGVGELVSMGGLGIALLFVGFLLTWIYFAAFECSSLRATVGKWLLGIVVTSEDGERITFQRSTVRYFAKFLSALMIAAGFFLSAFTRKKQAFHDLVSDCTVNLAVREGRILEGHRFPPNTELPHG